MIYLARNNWKLMLAVIAADLIIGAFIGDTVIRWELEKIGSAW